MTYLKWAIKGIHLMVLGSVGFIVLAGCDVQKAPAQQAAQWPAPPVSHRIADGDAALEKLWTRSDVFAPQHDLGPTMAAAAEAVFVLGRHDRKEHFSVLAFDAAKGELLWRNKTSLAFTLYATPSALYVSFPGNGKVTAYESRTGELLWSTHLPRTRSVVHIYAWNDLLHLDAIADVFHLLRADTGEVVLTMKYPFGNDIFMRTDEVTFAQQPTAASLQAVETRSGTPLWTAQAEYYVQAPVFARQSIFIRTERTMGSVYAIDRETGNVLWHTEENVLSNVAATDSAAFFLTVEGKLVGLDTRSGEVITSVRFEPAPFLVDDSDGHLYGYHVAVDEDAGLVYALLGDSAQLFCFRIRS